MSVLVYLENWDGKFKKLSFELVSFAQSIATGLGVQLNAISIGDVAGDELIKAGQYGARKILSVDDPRLVPLSGQAYTSVIAQAAAKEGANVIVLAHSISGKAIAPRVAVRMKAGLVTGVTGAPISFSPFVVRKKVYTGKSFSNVGINSEIRVLTLSQNSFGLVENPGDCTIERFIPELKDTDFSTTVKEVKKLTGKILLTDAEVVVAGGRGMKGPENFAPLEELATLLGAATACSRPVSDEGWRPHSEHVGQTGKIIAPNLYIACGISGAIQHLGGVSSAKVIVAINKDKDAPIFEAADYGIIGDVMQVLPAMITAVKEIKGE